MSSFNTAVITQKGLALNTKLIHGSGTITFTKMQTGSGVYDGSENLEDAVQLKSKCQEFPFNKKEIYNETTVRLRAVINNQDLLKEYQIREIGIFAQDPDEGEILYSISTAKPDAADTLPTFADSGLVTITVENYVSVSNASNVTIQTGLGAFASAEDMENFQAEMRVTLATYQNDLLEDSNRNKAELLNAFEGYKENLQETADSAISRVSSISSDMAKVSFQLALKGLIDTSDLSTVIVDEIDSSDAVVITSGTYADKKVYI